MSNYLPTLSFSPLLGSAAASCPDPCESCILVAGPHKAGKTTLLHRLKLGEPVTAVPTENVSAIEAVTFKNVTFTLWDFVSDRQMRRRLHQGGRNVDAVVFVVDSVDVERLDEAREGLAVLNFVWLRDDKLLVFANKQDAPGALSVNEVRARLGVDNVTTNRSQVLECAAITGDGLDVGLEWLARAVTSDR